MKTLKAVTIDELSVAFLAAYPNASADVIDLVSSSVFLSTQDKFGHFQSNLSMRLAKILQQKPRDIATKVSGEINSSIFSSVEVAGPGFINFTLSTAVVQDYVNAQLLHSRLGYDNPRVQERVIIDFSSPNIAKEMHVGHLRSTIIGDCIANMFEYMGCDVLRLNHVGDWGTAFGMLIVYLKQFHANVLSGEESASLSDLVVWYKAAKKQFDDDQSFKKQAQLKVVELQQGDTETLQVWRLICDISRRGFAKIYQILGVKLEERGESFYNPYLHDMITLLERTKLLTISDGAKCVYLDGFKNRDGDPLPLIVQKSDGGFNYASTDLAAIKHRVEVEKADRIIYVTDAGQQSHFSMVFACAEKAGIYSPTDVRVEHAGFGLVLGEDGKKFKTRSGDVVRLQDLLDEAIDSAKNILKQRQIAWGENEINHAAAVLGIGAVKYADLSNNRISDYQFSYSRMLEFDGNTAAFILYSNVRIKSIIDKSTVDLSSLTDDKIIIEHPAELQLAFQLSRFSEVLLKTSDDLTPHYLTDYLYQTAQKFNVFFRDCQVNGVKQQSSRLLLCRLCCKVLETGLKLLGIGVLERM